LKSIGDPAIERKASREKLPIIIKEFEDKAEELLKRLSTTDANFSHITEEDREPAKKAINKFKTWLTKRLEENQKLEFHKSILFKVSMLKINIKI
jgi:transcriptional regulator